MATYSLTLRNVKGSKLTSQEMDNNLLYLQSLSVATGSQGPIGPTGYSGVQGPIGNNGVQGLQGLQGAGFRWQGVWNPSGSYIANVDVVLDIDGSTYIKIGGDGNSGSNPYVDQVRWALFTQAGTRGTEWFQGTGNPLSTIPGIANNDFYLKTTDGSTWQYNSGNQTWYNIGSIEGPQGVQGPAGAGSTAEFIQCNLSSANGTSSNTPIYLPNVDYISGGSNYPYVSIDPDNINPGSGWSIVINQQGLTNKTYMVNVNWYVYNTNEPQSYAIYQNKVKKSTDAHLGQSWSLGDRSLNYNIWNLNVLVQASGTQSIIQFKRETELVTNPALQGKISIIEIK